MIAVDISQSMQIEDFTPNRLEAAKNVARDFIKGRKQDRIGIVVFSGDAFSLAPLTTDYELLNSYINDMNFDMIENRGTAIGSALAVVTNRMRESESKSKVCILVSDGENTLKSFFLRASIQALKLSLVCFDNSSTNSGGSFLFFS